MVYTELLEANRALGTTLTTPQVPIAVFGNITIDPIQELLEYALRCVGINAQVRMGRYDAIVEDSTSCGDARAVLVFWEPATVLDGILSTGRILDDQTLPDLVSFLRASIQSVLANLSKVPLVLFNRFSALPFAASTLGSSPIEKLCQGLNEVLDSAEFANVLRVDVDKVLAQISLPSSIDWRMYYSTRSLYTLAFLRAYVDQIQPALLNVCGRQKKAVIFDCDNTLWGGVIGEDGLGGIKMSSASATGRIFRDVQAQAVDLHKRGVLIGLCSKNNAEDVASVIEGHPDMLLRPSMIAVQRINWDSKPANLNSIAEELNVGLDSLVFVDDSPHEILGVQQQLPEIDCFRVPETISSYPAELRAFLRRFPALRTTNEDANRTAMYQAETRRKVTARAFSTIEEFSRSLDLRIVVHVDPIRHAARIAQLTQKTNQFNLTTSRCAEEQIAQAIASPRYLVLAVEVADRFGHYGIAGVAIIALDRSHGSADIETLLLSCRVLGRQVEHRFLDSIVELLKSEGIDEIRAKYCRTQKNSQVEDFYRKCGFGVLAPSEGETCYVLRVQDYTPSTAEYIECTYARRNQEDSCHSTRSAL